MSGTSRATVRVLAAMAMATAATLLVAAVAAPTVAPNVAAESGGHGREMLAELKKRFAAADSDGDGRLTREEAKAGMPHVYAAFDAIDVKKTGSVGLRDIVAWARQQRAAKP